MKRTVLMAGMALAVGVSLAFARGDSGAAAGAAQGGHTLITGFMVENGANVPDRFSHKDNWVMDWIEEKANIEWENIMHQLITKEMLFDSKNNCKKFIRRRVQYPAPWGGFDTSLCCKNMGIGSRIQSIPIRTNHTPSALRRGWLIKFIDENWRSIHCDKCNIVLR